jgi:hypothetical protein
MTGVGAPAGKVQPGAHRERARPRRPGPRGGHLRQAHQQNQTVIRALSQAAFAYAAGGYQVICDGIVGPWFIDAFRTAATACSIRLHYVILRPDQAVTSPCRLLMSR